MNPPNTFKRIEDLKDFLTAQQDKAHLLLPWQVMDYIPEGFCVSARLIVVPNEEGSVYMHRKNPNVLVLTKYSLDRIAAAAGVGWIRQKARRLPDGSIEVDGCHRVDSGSDPLFAEYSATAEITDFDGFTKREATCEFSLNLHDESRQAQELREVSVDSLNQARRNIAQVAESKAKNRVMRELLGVRPSYKPKELEKPFVCFRLAPDLSHPFVAQQFRDAKFGVGRILYGMAPERAQLAESDVERLALPPVATSALQLGLPQPAPLTPVIPPPPPPPLTEAPKNSQEREWIIREIDELYLQKKGLTREQISPNKPKLPDMASDILFALREHMKTLPDLPKKEDLV